MSDGSNVRRYIGDAVYASTDGWGIWLTTSDGLRTTNRIFLEPEVYAALERFVDDLRQAAGDSVERECAAGEETQ